MPIYKIYTERTINSGIGNYKFNIAEGERLNHSARVKIMVGSTEVGTVPSLPNHELDFDDTYLHDKCKISDTVPDEVADLAVCFAVYANEEINDYVNNINRKDINILKKEFDKCKNEFGKKVTRTKARKIANEKRDKDMKG